MVLRTTPRRTTAGSAVVTALAGAVSITGCGAAEPVRPAGDGMPKGWYAAVEQSYAAAEKVAPVTSVPRLSMTAGCDITTSVEIAGRSTDQQFGSGVSTLGRSGKRYICEFDDPSITLVVATFVARSDLAEAAAAGGAYSEAGNEQTAATFTIGRRKIEVVKTSYPTNRTHVDYRASYLDVAHQGLVRLNVEATNEGGLLTGYSRRQAAQDLAALLDKG